MQKRMLLSTAGMLAAMVLVNPARAADPLKVAAFDGPAPNNLGGHFGTFTPQAGEATFIAVEALDEAVKQGSEGSSIRLDYNVGKPGALNGFWVKLGPRDIGNNFDASAFTTLTFWVKGDSAIGIPNKVRVELKGDSGPIGCRDMTDIRDEWKKIEIPLADIAAQQVDIAKLNEIVFVFENALAAPGLKGSIWVDEIAFE